MLLIRPGVTLAVFLSVCTLAIAQDKVKLVRKADAGTTARYETKVAMEMTAEGQTMKIAMRQIDKVDFSAPGAKGEISYSEKTETLEQEFNGEKFEEPQDEEASKYTVAPNNFMLSYEPGDKEDVEGNKLGIQIGR